MLTRRRLGILAFGAAGTGMYLSARKSQKLPARMVLNVDLTSTTLVEKAPGPREKLLARLDNEGARQMLLRDAVGAIRRAAADDRVVGLVANVGAGALQTDSSLAQCQELAEAVQYFREKKAGGLTIAHGDAIEGKQYLVASSFERIYAQPGAHVQLPSFSAELPFLRSLLARYGFRFEGSKREQYKNGADMLIEDEATPAQIKATSRLLRSCAEQVAPRLGAARGLSEGQVRALTKRGLISTTEAVRAKLLDGALHFDEVLALTKERSGTSSAPVALARYHEALKSSKDMEGGLEQLAQLREAATRAARELASRVPFLNSAASGGDAVAPDAAAAAAAATTPEAATVFPSEATKPPRSAIALVTLQGTIARGNGTRAGVVSSGAARTQLQQALRDPAIKAVVLRIDSRGGDAVASDSIWREVHAVRAAGKPVVVSMGAYAASGGYLIATAADKIVAQPGTITGSIGVLSAKLDASRWLRKQRITVTPVLAARPHEGSAPISAARPYTPAQRATMEALVDGMYEHFRRKVAEGRHLSARRTREVARGRVWTGQQALSRGLVDELGGLDAACGIAAKEAGLHEAWRRDAVDVRDLGEKTLADLAKKALGRDGGADEAAPSLGGLLVAWLQPPLEGVGVALAHAALESTGLASVAQSMLRADACAPLLHARGAVLAEMPPHAHVRF